MREITGDAFRDIVRILTGCELTPLELEEENERLKREVRRLQIANNELRLKYEELLSVFIF